MGHIHKGRIYVCMDVGRDTHNCTLRMHKAIADSTIVLAYNKPNIEKLLRALLNKDRFIID